MAGVAITGSGITSKDWRKPLLAALMAVDQEALMRAQVWNPAARVAPGTFPSMNAMLKSQLGGAIVTETDEEAAARYRTPLAAEGL